MDIFAHVLWTAAVAGARPKWTLRPRLLPISCWDTFPDPFAFTLTLWQQRLMDPAGLRFAGRFDFVHMPLAVSCFRFDGISWSRRRFLVSDYAALAVTYIFRCLTRRGAAEVPAATHAR